MYEDGTNEQLRWEKGLAHETAYARDLDVFSVNEHHDNTGLHIRYVVRYYCYSMVLVLTELP